MTGFGRGEAVSGNYRYVVQIKTVNNRFLELALKLPPMLWAYEAEARAMFQKALSRGKVDLHWKESVEGASTGVLSADPELALAYKNAAEGLAAAIGSKDPLRLDQVLRFPGVIRSSQDAEASEEEIPQRWEAFCKALGLALADLGDSREREGAELGRELADLLDQGRTLTADIEKMSLEMQPLFRERLAKRMALALEGFSGPLKDDTRLMQEAALAADKADIREEIVRFGLHAAECARVLAEGGPSGKRLDFLAQELLREANTMGSKSPDAALSHKVVALKAVVEKIKEQIQNLE